MQSKASTVKEYLASLPEDRRTALEAVRKVVLANLDRKGGLEEGMQYGMIGYYLSHRAYPDGYHCDPKQPLPYASLASQKNHMSLYLFCAYTSPKDQALFEKEWKATGKKLDMGKSCVRFKRLEDVPLEVVGRAVKRASAKRFVQHYEAAVKPTTTAAKARSKSRPKTRPKAAKKTSRTR